MPKMNLSIFNESDDTTALSKALFEAHTVEAFTPPAAPAEPSVVALGAPPAPMTDEEYFVRTEVSAGDLRRGYTVPYDAAHARANPPEPTQSMLNGTAVHTAMLVPEEYAARVANKPEGLNLSSTEGKAFKAAAQKSGRIIVDNDTHTRAMAYAGALPAVIEQITDTPNYTTTKEVPIVWDDPIAGPSRCKPDCLVHFDRLIHVSVKTFGKPLSSSSWNSALISGAMGAGYDLHEYHYARGIAAQYLGSPERWREIETWHVICTMTGAPRIVRAMVPPEVMERVVTIYAERAPAIARALNEWRPDGVISDTLTVTLPKWADYSTPDELPEEEEA